MTSTFRGRSEDLAVQTSKLLLYPQKLELQRFRLVLALGGRELTGQLLEPLRQSLVLPILQPNDLSQRSGVVDGFDQVEVSHVHSIGHDVRAEIPG